MNPFRRTLLLAPLALAVAGTPALAETIPLAELSRYLNSLRTAESAFTQLNSDGSQSTGKLFIHRPNRMRFEYAAPDEALVLASAGQVAIFDDKSNQPPSQYPLSKTPLNLILDSNVDLTRDRMVMQHAEERGATVVVAQDPAHPEYGSIKLYFSGNPVELRQWTITDDVGSETTVVLQRLSTGESYPPSLFSIPVERSRRN
jgi:outer membrane lipoprotein-sorting protein